MLLYSNNESENMTQYSCYLLTKESKELIRRLWKPKFPIVFADHITYAVPGLELPPEANEIKIVGYASDDKVEALLVHVDNQKFRPDGIIYHITLSIDQEAGAQPSDAKDLFNGDYDKFDVEVIVDTKPKVI